MDSYRKHNHKKSTRDENPSFSSTLLDQIYRSIDETKDDQYAPNFQRIQNWIERKTPHDHKTSNQIYSTKLVADFVNFNSSRSSSDSSSNYGLSSSRPKPIRTISIQQEKKAMYVEKPNHESSCGGGVVKGSKLKALGDLKQQPVSPGAKLAGFLNSIFAKKGKISGFNSSNTSPASSTSRSCLSKTPCSRGKLSNNGTKRCVRFYPVSEILGHKSLENYYKNQSVEEAARELLENYQRKAESRMEEDDDDASYASSDLFELDSLDNNNNNNIMGKYMEELPVYETTYLDNNRAIANGLLV